MGATLCCSARASYRGGFSCCGARALGTWASVVVAHRLQQLWHMGLVAPWHVKSSRTRARTPVPCIGRHILNQCATRGVPLLDFRMSPFSVNFINLGNGEGPGESILVQNFVFTQRKKILFLFQRFSVET